MGWKPLPDKFAQNFTLKWVESRLSVKYDAFKEGQYFTYHVDYNK